MAYSPSPAFQFYPRDFVSDAKQIALSLAGAGIYIRLLCQCWLEGSLPLDHSALAKLCGTTVQKFDKEWDLVSACFEQKDGRLIHRRLNKERRKQAEYRQLQREKGVRGAEKRWQRPSSGHSQRDSTGHATAINRAWPKDGSSSASSSADCSPSTEEARITPIESDEHAERAGNLVRRYGTLYSQHRHGAIHRQRPALDYHEAISLVKLWPDDRLDKLAVLVLTTDDEWITRTDRSFKIFALKATWADARLAAWEAEQKAKVAR